MRKAGIVSLGCARNLVDSETILGSLRECGYDIAEVDDGVDICLVNTCAFVESARKESVEAILELAGLKKKGKIKSLIVCGCLPQLYREKLSRQIPEADLVLGTGEISKISLYIKSLGRAKRRTEIGQEPRYLYDERTPRFIIGPKHRVYIKISEGCSNFCSYCIISKLRGPFRSRSVDSVLAEAARLSKGGALREIDLIGQDTTLFGMDRYGKMALSHLLRSMCRLNNGVRWIRALYTHPAHYTDELISTIRSEDKICKYLDIPIQHASDRILKLMNRRTTGKDIRGLIHKLRRSIPGVALRTSVIVGFPGETESDFKELLRFIKETGFERLGSFVYSREDGTRASTFRSQVPEAVKKERLDELMKAQQVISLRHNRSMVGKVIDVLIDEKAGTSNMEFAGRTEHDAPEVDCGVLVSGKGIKIGEFCRVKITDATEYDLIGEKA